jgi:3-oxoadipate enol-lactonase
MPHAQLGDVRLHYRFDGLDDAAVLVLSNSLGTEMAMWAPQIPALGARFRVLRYDARGHGGSSVPPGPYSIAQMGSDVLALLAHVGVAQAHFCGLSMGGMVGLWLGIHAPAHFQRIAVSDTAARIGAADVWNTRIAAVRASGMAGIAESVLARWFTPSFLASGAPAVEDARRMLLATPPEGYVASCAAVRDADLRDDVGRISAPTLVIAGRHDPVTTTADARDLVERIDGARYHELDAPHISNLERPAEFTAAVLDFLTR